MRVLLVAAILSFTIYSMWSAGTETVQAAREVSDLRQEVRDAKRLMAALTPCRDEMFQYCSEQKSPLEIASCLRSNQARVSETCSTALEKV